MSCIHKTVSNCEYLVRELNDDLHANHLRHSTIRSFDLFFPSLSPSPFSTMYWYNVCFLGFHTHTHTHTHTHITKRKKQSSIHETPHLFNGHVFVCVCVCVYVCVCVCVCVCVETFIVQVQHISGYLADTHPYKRRVELFYSTVTAIFSSSYP